MSQGRTFRLSDVAVHLGVTHQRASQMYAEGKFPKPDQLDGVSPLWKRTTIERWARSEWWGTRRWRRRPG